MGSAEEAKRRSFRQLAFGGHQASEFDFVSTRFWPVGSLRAMGLRTVRWSGSAKTRVLPCVEESVACFRFVSTYAPVAVTRLGQSRRADPVGRLRGEALV
jgi:hypothetical protein